MQRLLHGTSVLRTRRCRASYGILCDKIYDKVKHEAGRSYKNPADDKKYVEGHIQWFIKKGDVISEDAHIRLELSRIASFGNQETAWEDAIVTSNIHRDCLPQYSNQGDARRVCKILSKADPDALATRRKYWFGKKFLYVKYGILAFVGQDNIRFETEVNGEKVGEGQTAQVPWEYIGDELAASNDVEEGVLRGDI